MRNLEATASVAAVLIVQLLVIATIFVA